MAAKLTEGKGMTKSKTPEEHANDRKAAQQRKQRGHHGANRTASDSTPLFDRLNADRRQLAEERRVSREAEAITHRSTQVRVARESQFITNLKPDTTAHKMAHAILNLFEHVEPEIVNGKLVRSRTKVAKAEALLEMSDADIKREKAIQYGCAQARNALQEAYATLKNR